MEEKIKKDMEEKKRKAAEILKTSNLWPSILVVKNPKTYDRTGKSNTRDTCILPAYKKKIVPCSGVKREFGGQSVCFAAGKKYSEKRCVGVLARLEKRKNKKKCGQVCKDNIDEKLKILRDLKNKSQFVVLKEKKKRKKRVEKDLN